MDVINTQNLHDAISRRFSTGQNRAAKFTAAFLSAYNDVLMELFNHQYIDEPTLLTSLSEDSTIEIRYLPQIKTGLYFFLQTSGEWVKGDDVDRYAGLKWKDALGSIENAQTLQNVADGGDTSPWGDDV